MEVVVVSFDSEKEKFYQEYAETPFAYFEILTAKVKDLISKYEITGIPKVLVFDKEGALISRNGRVEILNEGLSCVEIWRKKISPN